MAVSPEYTLTLSPRTRFDLIDVNALLREHHGDVLARYPRALYASYHTTAGYVEEPDLQRLGLDGAGVRAHVEAYRRLYPEGAGYRHDHLPDRHELTEEQKKTEPLNADAHLSFIGAGLTNCVTYTARPDDPALFVDLDGVGAAGPRTRRTTVVGFGEERLVARCVLDAPASGHRVDSFNLRDEGFGLFDELQALVERHGVSKGRLELRLADDDVHAGLTVNEFETLLMSHDVREVMRNPLYFAAQKTWHALRHPGAVPERLKDYAKHDVVLVVNKALDRLGLRGTRVEDALNALMGNSARKRLRMKRCVNLPVSDHDRDGVGEIVQGTYQSPILIQWNAPRQTVRHLEARLYAFD